MTRIEFFSFTDEQWNDIKTVVHEALGLDADVIMICEKGGSVVTPLRDCIEIKASTHILQLRDLAGFLDDEKLDPENSKRRLEQR
jgi:hypothetical protein